MGISQLAKLISKSPTLKLNEIAVKLLSIWAGANRKPKPRSMPSEIDGTNSGIFIILNYVQSIALIGGTEYGGEIKKSVFTVMNELLPLQKAKIIRYGVNCWLVNTGWTSGPFGIGKRISIRYTRALLNSALDGELNEVKFRKDPIFGFEVPAHCEGVPDIILDPANTWPDRKMYMNKYKQLSALFIENFKKFVSACPPEVIAAGPVRR